MPDPTPFRCVLDAWQAHEQELHAYLVAQTRDGARADDLLQDVFLKALRLGAGFCTLESPRAWLFQVSRHAMVDQHRLRKRTLPVVEQLAAPVPSAAPVDDLAACLDDALQALAPDDRDILLHCDIRGLTQRAYAKDRGLTIPAVKARIQRARVRLRQHLIAHYGVRFDATGHVCCRVPPREQAG